MELGILDNLPKAMDIALTFAGMLLTLVAAAAAVILGERCRPVGGLSDTWAVLHEPCAVFAYYTAAAVALFIVTQLVDFRRGFVWIIAGVLLGSTIHSLLIGGVAE